MTEVYFFWDKTEKTEKQELSLLAKRFVVFKSGANLTICKTENGKPYLKELPYFHFNISHSKGALAIAFSNSPVGVDTERLRKPDLRVAERFFTEKENEYIKQCPERFFFEIWTKKEAYIKKNGLSLKDLSYAKTDGIVTYFIEEYAISVCSDDLNNINIYTDEIDTLRKILENQS